MQSRHWMDVQEQNAATVVTFTCVELLHDENVDWIADTLEKLVERAPLAPCILNFEHVRLLASDMIGRLLGLQRRVQSLGGQLVLCGFNDDLLGAMKVLQMDKVFRIVPTRAAALQPLAN